MDLKSLLLCCCVSRRQGELRTFPTSLPLSLFNRFAVAASFLLPLPSTSNTYRSKCVRARAARTEPFPIGYASKNWPATALVQPNAASCGVAENDCVAVLSAYVFTTAVTVAVVRPCCSTRARRIRATGACERDVPVSFEAPNSACLLSLCLRLT